ncbi:hypothetical protein FRB94_011558 [Tulasnella sp. JGI-2019a]|nr:hypothetical protein FRB94_011558 [Tulasnella sp. JGI-2019a]KAG9034173.1 hypothetical protein FRB95_013692 [Tulasnella sp. JGI-2019a]
MSSKSFPKTIKAIGFHKNGDLNVIEELKDIPFPESDDQSVIVKVEYAGVNFIDTYQRAGLYPTAKFPMILGSEASGTVVKLPTSEESIHGLKIGDRVAVILSGSFAEYIAVPAWKVGKLPPNVDTKAAGAVILQGLTALTFARESYPIQKGDVILIYAAAGGVGTLLTGIALHAGATVIATVSSETKAEYVRSLGAQHVLNLSTQNVVDEVLKITNGEGVHAVFDGVGKDTFEDNFKLIRRKGTIVSLGNSSGVAPPLNILRLGEKNLRILRPRLFGYIATPEELRHYEDELFSLLGSGVIKAQIHQEYPFTAAGVQQAQKDITSRGTIGKLLINVSSATT